MVPIGRRKRWANVIEYGVDPICFSRFLTWIGLGLDGRVILLVAKLNNVRQLRTHTHAQGMAMVVARAALDNWG